MGAQELSKGVYVWVCVGGAGDLQGTCVPRDVFGCRTESSYDNVCYIKIKFLNQRQEISKILTN